MQRYVRNLGSISSEEQKILNRSQVCVIGCGGLGGFVIEMLARLGIGTIIVIDGDRFETSNLNRQLLATEDNLKKTKTSAAVERIKQINSSVKCIEIPEIINSENAEEFIAESALVIEALDNIESRFVVQAACQKKGIPFVHGAVEKWFGQVSTIFPDDKTLQKIYPDKNIKNKPVSVLAFTPACIASYQVSEAIKILLQRGALLRNKLLHIDLGENEYIIIDL